MKKLITILLLFIGFYSFGQDVVGSRVIAKQALYVNGVWVDSIRVDTVGISGDNRTLMTSGAVYKFVSNRSGGGGSGTPGSPTNSIQYNNAGSFGGSANLLYDASLLTSLSAGLGVTQTDTKGIVLTNTTSAALGAQQISPALRLTGQGWQTSTSGNQTVDFRQYALPVQGVGSPSVKWKLQSQINAGGYSDNLQVSSLNEFSLGTGTASAGGHSIAFYGSTSSGVGAVTFSQNATNAGANTFVAAGQNMVVDAGTVGAASLGTDGHIYATADYSFVANDANLVKGESGSAFGFGTEVHAQNSFGAGNTNVLGALSTGSGTGNQYTDEIGMGTQLRITGNRNITFGTRVQNTGTEAVAIGMGFGSTYLVNSRSGVIALGTGSDSATVYIENAGGSTGAFGRFWARGKALIGDELTVNSASDAGDFKLQVTGGLYADITGKTWSVQGTAYNSGASLVALAIDTLTGLIYRKTASGGSGTVTSVAAGFGTNFTTITTTGSVVVDTTSGGVQSWVRGQARQDSTVSKGSIVGTIPNFQPWYTHYLGMTSSTFDGFFWSFNGAGAAVTGINTGATVPTGWMFGQLLRTGTTSSGFAFHYTQSNSTYGAISISSSYRYNVGIKIQLEDLSDGTETFHYFAGFADNATAFSSVSYAVCFRYAHTDSSGQWIAVTKNGGANLTEKATGVTVAADTDYFLEISVFGGTAYYYIKTGTGARTLVATISTNIPTSQTSIVDCIRKTAGTTNRDAKVGFFAYGQRDN